jgi:hypothetical protein
MTRYSDRPRDPAYVQWVRRQRCAVAGELRTPSQCGGPVEAHHAGERAFGRKAADDTCVPLCVRHHREYHDVRGFFAHLSRTERRTLVNEWIRCCRMLYEQAEGEIGL